MIEFALFVLGYTSGIIICIFLFHPTKSWRDGYESAKEMYSDWDDGFHHGWDCAFRAIKDIANKYKLEGEA